MESQTPQTATTAAKKTEITNNVLARINQLKEIGEIKIPENYSPENALQGAYLVLVEQTTKGANGDVCVLDHCSTASIANSLMRMITQGLSVQKNQCYFIPYGTQLNFQRSYLGSLALAKRVGNVKEVNPVVIYEGDEFTYEIDGDTGRKKVVKHTQNIDNIDNAKIKGAYAVRVMNDGAINTEIMSIAEIRTAWSQGATKGQSPAHKNFTQEMCKKTVINRACKEPIATSDDSNLYSDDDEPVSKAEEVRKEIEENSGAEEIGFEEISDKKVVNANGKDLTAKAFKDEKPSALNSDNADPGF